MVQKFEKQSLRILWLNTRHPVLKHFRDLFFCTTVGGPNFPPANSLKPPFYKISTPPPPPPSLQVFLSVYIFILIWKDSVSDMLALVVYAEKGIPFAWGFLSSENSEDSYLSFRMVLLHAESYLFPFIDHCLQLCAWFLMLFHLTLFHLY